MQLVYKFDINHSDRLCSICRVTNNLYNQALYIVRNELKDNDRWLFYTDLDRIMKNVTNLEGTVNYRLVKSHVAQQTLRVLDKAMKGYVKAVKDWSKNPGRYNGKPELPCYHKRGGMSNAIYTNQFGKRVKRGLFKSAVGKVINADVNGALNIGRKVFGDSFMITDSGRWYRPERINVLKCV